MSRNRTARSENGCTNPIGICCMLAFAALIFGCSSPKLITKEYEQRIRMTKAEAVQFLKKYLRNEENASVDENRLAFTYKHLVNVTGKAYGSTITTNMYREEDFFVNIPYAKVVRIVKTEFREVVKSPVPGVARISEIPSDKLHVYDNNGVNLSGGFNWHRIDDSFISALLALCPNVESGSAIADPSDGIRDAIMKGDTPKLSALIEGHPEFANYNTDYGTPLYIAAENGKTDAAEILIRKGARVDGITKNYWGELTPLYAAAKAGRKDMVDYLLAKGADVNAKTERKFTALHIAAHGNHTEIVDLLIAKGAQVNARSDLGLTPLYSAAENGRLDAARLLVAKGAEIDAAEKKGFSPLHKAAMNGNRDFAEFLIANGAKANARSDFGFTPLYCAAENNHLDVAKLLISNKADVNLKNQINWSPLHIAAQGNHRDMADFLINNGAELNAKNKDGSTPLHIAVEKKNRDLVELLIRKRADVNMKNDSGRTPLATASQTNQWEIANLLRKNGGTE
jgi:ankyrin repeat protein